MKKTVINCITAIACAIAICASAGSAFTKLADAKVEAAKNVGAVSGEMNGDDMGAPDDGAVPDSWGDVGEPDNSGDSDVSAPSEEESSAATDENGATKAPTTPNGSTKPAVKKPSTKAEVLAYFNTSVNKIKTSAKSGVKNYEKNTQAGSFELSGPLKAFSSAIDGLVNKNMGEKEGHTGLKLTSNADMKKYLPVENEAWASKLTVDNISDATLTEQGGKYIVTIKVKPDAASTNTAHGTGNHGKAFSIVSVDMILDNAGPVKSLISGKVSLGYRNGRIMAQIDPSTGNITRINYYHVWELNVNLGSTKVCAPFGIEQDFTINW